MSYINYAQSYVTFTVSSSDGTPVDADLFNILGPPPPREVPLDPVRANFEEVMAEISHMSVCSYCNHIPRRNCLRQWDDFSLGDTRTACLPCVKALSPDKLLEFIREWNDEETIDEYEWQEFVDMLRLHGIEV
jgi:hypothetical protein